MKRVFVALALVGAACNAGGDRYLPRFGAHTTVTSTTGPVVFTVAPGGSLYYVELRTNELFTLVLGGGGPQRLLNTGDKPDALVVDNNGSLFVAARTTKHRLRVTQYREPGLQPRLIWSGPVSRFPAHLTVTSKNQLILGYASQILRLDRALGPNQKPEVISAGYTDPVVIAPRGGSRLWVADNGVPGTKERVGRGREKNVAKRNRFATALPPYTNPSGMTLLRDELLVCSKTHKKVYRLHIGIDEVARRRDWLPGLVCDRDIGVLADGSLITSQNGAIYKYPPRA